MTHQVSYEHTYQALFDMQPPQSVTWETSAADILNPGRGFMAAFDYTMQLQVGCPGGCLFCYVPAGPRLTPVSVRGDHGQAWGYVIRNKAEVIGKLQKHLQRGHLADKTLYWSPITDPYAASPVITRTVWQTFLETAPALRRRRLVIQTRFRPERDVSLLEEYCATTSATDGGPPLLVSYSIGTDRNDLIRAWEKATPLVEQRLATIQALRQAGIFVVATLSPFGLWLDLTGTLNRFKAWGVAYVTCLFTKRERLRRTHRHASWLISVSSIPSSSTQPGRRRACRKCRPFMDRTVSSQAGRDLPL
jgi:DNA repair photolyase